MTSAREIAAAVRAGRTTAVEAVTAAPARIERVDPVLCAFTEVWEEEAALRGRAGGGRADRGGGTAATGRGADRGEGTARAARGRGR